MSWAFEDEAPGPMASSLFVVADEVGFVGAFSSLGKARELALDRFPAATLLTYRFRAEPGPAEPGPAPHVWVVLYTNGAIAHASSSEELARGIHRKLVAFGLAYDDDIGHWKHPVDQVQALAAERLATRGAARAAGGEEKRARAPSPESLGTPGAAEGTGPKPEGAASLATSKGSGPPAEPESAGPEGAGPEGAGPGGVAPRAAPEPESAEAEGAGPPAWPRGPASAPKPASAAGSALELAEQGAAPPAAEDPGAGVLDLGLRSIDLRPGVARADEALSVSPLE